MIAFEATIDSAAPLRRLQYRGQPRAQPPRKVQSRTTAGFLSRRRANGAEPVQALADEDDPAEQEHDGGEVEADGDGHEGL